MMVLDKNDPNYRQCSLSVMDNIADPDIVFDEKGVCNYVHEHNSGLTENIPLNKEFHFQFLIDEIKKAGRGMPYDCLTGISGGVDSSYLIYKAKEWGLRPLIVHFDNGWNSEIAISNIQRIITKTGFDLYTIVVDWEEFKDLQLSYIKSNVVDLEVPTDHAIYSTWHKLAKKFKIKYVLNGNNYNTESIMPQSWNFNKDDSLNLLSIHNRFGTQKLKTYPLFKTSDQFVQRFFHKINIVKPLNLIDYRKELAKSELKDVFGWVDYGGKHYESFYTKFYQAFILPEKFKIDKRKAHLSNLILSGEISRDMALAELTKPLYDSFELENDISFFLKKMGLKREVFEDYLISESIPHKAYGIQPFLKDQYKILKLISPFYRFIFKRND